MERRIFVVFMAILPVFVLVSGCGSGGGGGGGYSGYGEYPYNPNEQHIYVHTEDDDFVEDMYLLNKMRQESMNDYFDHSRRTMDSMEDSIRKMRGSTMGTLGIIDNARRQQEAYQRQKDAEMRRAYGGR